MDRLIKRFDADADDDLMLVAHRGVAYQRNMTRGRVAYDAAYFDHYRRLGGSSIEVALNAGRVAMTERAAVRRCKIGPVRVLDVGVGSGAFIEAACRAGFDAKGIDVNPVAVEMLRAAERLGDSPSGYDVVTFWDALEHIEDPESVLKHVDRGAAVIVALPIFESLAAVRESKHYKPGEHLYYFTRDGFVDWMAMRGFRLVEESDHETAAGREAIGAFAFVRDLPGYAEHVDAYREMHSTRHYGDSATELYLTAVRNVVKTHKPRSILDYGCGRSDLVAHFWRDGERFIARYDPAIPAFKRMPAPDFDLLLCCDVMEHIPIADVDTVLAEIKAKAPLVFFTISTKPARARLPDGRNSHVTLLRKTEWVRWLRDVFGEVQTFPSSNDFELIAIAGKRAKAHVPHWAHHCPSCSAPMYVDSFNPIRRAVEWFMRCSKCGAFGLSYPDAETAEREWARSSIIVGVGSRPGG